MSLVSNSGQISSLLRIMKWMNMDQTFEHLGDPRVETDFKLIFADSTSLETPMTSAIGPWGSNLDTTPTSMSEACEAVVVLRRPDSEAFLT